MSRAEEAWSQIGDIESFVKAELRRYPKAQPDLIDVFVAGLKRTYIAGFEAGEAEYRGLLEAAKACIHNSLDHHAPAMKAYTDVRTADFEALHAAIEALSLRSQGGEK